VRDFIECEGGRWIPRERIEYVLRKPRMPDRVKTVDGEFLDTLDFTPDQTAATIAVTVLMADGETMPVVLRTSEVSGAVFVNETTSAFLSAGKVFFVASDLYEAEKAIRSEMGGAAWEFGEDLDVKACLLFLDNWQVSK